MKFLPLGSLVMAQKRISNEMIYEQLLQLSEDLSQFKKETNQRFNAIDERLNKIDERLNSMDQRLNRLEDRVDVIYDERKEVTVRLTEAWAGMSFLMACVAGFTSLGVYQLIF